MTYDDWLTTPPDDDPEGDYQQEERCPDCGASWDDPCESDCNCRYCRYCRERDRRAQETPC